MFGNNFNSKATKPAFSQDTVLENMPLRSIFGAFVLTLSMPFGFSVAADTPIVITSPEFISDGSKADVEVIRDLIRNVEDDSSEDGSMIALKLQPVSDQIFPYVIEACGHEDDFEKFFSSHQFLPYILSDEEQLFLGSCMYSVFEFADENLGFSAPGLYRRFDYDYVSAGIQLGYQCGYRTQQLFAYFALSIWLKQPQDIQRDDRFRCLGDLHPTHAYSEHGIKFGVKRISDESLFYQRVFESWADAQRYISYIKLIRENKRLATCKELASNPYDDQSLQRSLLENNHCSQSANKNIWRK